MPDRMKRTIAVCTMIGWVFLFGFSFSEVLEAIDNKLECPEEELVETALSLLAEKTIFIWDEFPEIPTESMTVAAGNDLVISISLKDSGNLQHDGSPPGPKVFKLLSTYRL